MAKQMLVYKYSHIITEVNNILNKVYAIPCYFRQANQKLNTLKNNAPYKLDDKLES